MPSFMGLFAEVAESTSGVFPDLWFVDHWPQTVTLPLDIGTSILSRALEIISGELAQDYLLCTPANIYKKRLLKCPKCTKKSIIMF